MSNHQYRLDEYQLDAIRTLPHDAHADSRIGLNIGAYNLWEAGEAANLIKKHLLHGHDLDREKLKAELGDVMWAVAVLAHCSGINLSDVAEHNRRKLAARYPSGFSTEASINRVDP